MVSRQTSGRPGGASSTGTPPENPSASHISNATCSPVSSIRTIWVRSSSAYTAGTSVLYVSGMADEQMPSSALASASPSRSCAAAARSSSQDRTAAASLASSSAVFTSGSRVPGSARTTTCSRASAESPTVALYSTATPPNACRSTSWARSRTAVVYRSRGR